MIRMSPGGLLHSTQAINFVGGLADTSSRLQKCREVGMVLDAEEDKRSGGQFKSIKSFWQKLGRHFGNFGNMQLVHTFFAILILDKN